ncbi:MAG: hypothetical protein LUF92_12220 [Clostridiales bacterium]|nr:hypothetical protein [Clostridiales bacterium]
MPMVPLDEELSSLIKEVRTVRAKTNICPSAMPGVNVTDLLNHIVTENIYKEDYNVLTMKLLEEKTKYEDAITSVSKIVKSGVFDSF